ncbi:hypothetical protein VNI00_017753 [Paramarasmius palmivorus]|uniref:Uncharacterized protein n=1 Tax=Paramarasmius palmivorus TaxID=297713 RepID=A0AAW0B5L0_9AGAR
MNGIRATNLFCHGLDTLARESGHSLVRKTICSPYYSTLLPSGTLTTTTTEAIKKIFDSSETRSGCSYSPYIAGADEELEALLLRAFLIAEDPENESPLSTPPSSPLNVTAQLPEDENLTPPTPPTPSQTPGLSLSTDTEASPPCASSKPSHESQRKRRVKSAAEIAREKAKSKRARHKARQTLPSIIYSRNPEYLVQQGLRSSILNAARVIPQVFNTHTHFNPSESGYLGLEKGLPEKRDYTLEELTDPEGDFRFAKLLHTPSSSQPLTSSSGAVMGVVIPGPQNDPSWSDNVQAANHMIEEFGAYAKFTPPRLTKTQQHLIRLGLGGPTVAHPRRGAHNALSYGPSTGNGQKVPQMLRQHSKNKPIMEKVRGSRVFQRFARFMSCMWISLSCFRALMA